MNSHPFKVDRLKEDDGPHACGGVTKSMGSVCNPVILLCHFS